jgi:hypothetical protein
VHARGAVPVQALVSGSVEFGAFSGSSAIAAYSPAAISFSLRPKATSR